MLRSPYPHNRVIQKPRANSPEQTTPDSMKKNRIPASLMFIALAVVTANAHALYAEQWMSPPQLKQEEEARTVHRKQDYGVVNLAEADVVGWKTNRYLYQCANLTASITVQRFHAARRALSLVRWDCAVMRWRDNAKC